MIPLKVLVEQRLEKKVRRAQEAFVRAHTTKDTINCRHHGSILSDKLYVCKIQCQGGNEGEAGVCHNHKARACTEFSFAKSPETLKDEFRDMPEEELALRWPSIGELLWVKHKIEEGEQASDGQIQPPPSEVSQAS